MKVLRIAATAAASLTTGLALAVGLGSPVQASTKPAGGTTIEGQLLGVGFAPCRLAGSDFRPRSVVGSGARASLNEGSARRFGPTGSTTESGQLETKVNVSVKPTLRSGGLANLAIRASGYVSYWPSGQATTCGSKGTIVGGTSATTIQTVQPVGAAGWLTLNVENKSTSPTSFQVAVFDAAGKVSAFVPQSSAATRKSVRLYLPARGMVRIWANPGVGAQAQAPLTKLSTTHWSSAIDAKVETAGAATGAQRGKSNARKIVTLPAAVDCRGTMAVKVTKYGKKHAKTITIRVNGKAARTIKRPKVKFYSVKVPTSGPISVKAKTKPKQGKTRTTARTYLACR